MIKMKRKILYILEEQILNRIKKNISRNNWRTWIRSSIFREREVLTRELSLKTKTVNLVALRAFSKLKPIKVNI